MSVVSALYARWGNPEAVNGEPYAAEEYSPAVPPEEEGDDRLFLEHSDRLFANDALWPGASILVGNVRFRHGGMTLTCDSAMWYQARQDFDAFGNVYMWQGDTLSLVSEELYYKGARQLAQARLAVELKHRNTVLTTDSLDYARLQSLGYFLNGGTMVDGDNTLVSDYGEYSTATHDAAFYYNVLLNNPKFVLDGDTLFYNTDSKVASVVGPTNINHGQDHVYTERGFYHTTPDQMILLERSRLFNKDRELIADSIFWDNKENWGEAWGDIFYDDIKNKNSFTGDYCYSNDSTGYSMATDRARTIDYSQKDTLYAHADTFKVFTYNIRTDSVYRVMHAYPHMRAYRIDMQAVADSMVFDGRDSTLHFYKDPVMWQNHQQVLGEEIIAFLNDSTIDSVQVNRQALTVERMDSVHYNQVAGNYMHLYMTDGKVRETYVETNVFVNYYPLDDDSLMIGMNHVETAEMRMYFDAEQQVDRIWMPAAEGTLYPVPMIPANMLYLQNFAWLDYMRPKDRDDIFNWVPKGQEAVLKESVLRSPPLQKLDKLKRK